jgi:ankyrin repeat domain-containing protein 50
VIDFVQKHCSQQPKSAVAYWYFTFTDMEKQNVSNFLSSMIVQLLSQRTDTPQLLRDAFAQSLHGAHRPTTESLEKMLQAIIEGFEHVYIIVDALDECPKLDGSRERLLDRLQRILMWKRDPLHVFLTSRKETDIEATLRQSVESLDNYVFKSPERYVRDDVQIFLQSMLQRRTFGKWSPILKQEVEDVLLERAQGM